MFTKTAELQIKNYHIFFEDTSKPNFGWTRDGEGVFYIWLYRVRLSIYGRTFNRLWKEHGVPTVGAGHQLVCNFISSISTYLLPPLRKSVPAGYKDVYTPEPRNSRMSSERKYSAVKSKNTDRLSLLR